MKRVIILTVAVIAACVIFIGCNTAKTNGVSLHETPQIYILQGEDSFTTMPTVTLYENGNAWLSQPPISSYALFTIGKYEIDGNKLTVKHNDSSVTFEISDGGDTLTLLSANLSFTKIGAVYKYRSNVDYLSSLTKVDGKKLTFDTLRELAKKVPNLAVSDFDRYEHFDMDPNYHIFDIEGKYTLKVILSADGNIHCIVERNSSGESFPLNLNGSTGYVFDAFLGLTSIPKCETRKWLDFLGTDEAPWNESKELTLTEFPGVTFKWTSEKVTAGEKELFWGMPVWNVYLTDLTNDGKPELCATVSLGSGIIDDRIIVFDYAADKMYQLSDRMYYDYFLSLDNEKLMVTQTNYLDSKPLATAELRLVNGEIFRFGNTIEDKNSDTD